MAEIGGSSVVAGERGKLRLLQASTFTSNVDRFAITPLLVPIGLELQASLAAVATVASGYFLAYGPEETTAEELIRVCETRWQIEESLAEAKGEVGLDQYEVRKWHAWYRHATLCLLAHAYLVVVRRAARQEERGKRGAPIPA